MRMRIKNFTLLFLMGLFGLFSLNVQAQEDSSIDPSEIRYWVGEGENQAILAINWATPDTCLAWGFRFTAGELTVKDMMDIITSVDHRLSVDAAAGYVMDIRFDDGFIQAQASEGGFWMYNVNGAYSSDYYDARVLADGDLVKWGDTNCGTILDPVNWIYVWEAPIVPVYPLADEAMIDASEICYWVGEGEHEVIFAVNWAAPDTCLAWGYRFDADNVTVEKVMDDLAVADQRFGYEGGGGMISDITFDAGTLHLGLSGFYWMYNINGSMAWYGYNEQLVVDGDFIKWGDESCGTEIAQWTLVWTTPVTPVSNPTSVVEQDNAASLYPNPATTFTMLSVKDMSAATVTVSDLQGRVLNSFGVSQTAEPIRIETADLVPGLYFVTVNDGVNRQTVKLSVK